MTFEPGYIREKSITLIGYSNNNYADNQLIFKISDPKSITGYVFFLINGLISG